MMSVNHMNEVGIIIAITVIHNGGYDGGGGGGGGDNARDHGKEQDEEHVPQSDHDDAIATDATSARASAGHDAGDDGM